MTTTKIYVKPKKADDGKTVLPVMNPETARPLPEEGEEVTPSTYWHRRLKDGEVEHVVKAAQPKTSKKGE